MSRAACYFFCYQP